MKLIELQNENVQLLKQYEVCRKKLNAKQIKFENLTKMMITEDYFNLNQKIKEKELELKQIKKKNEILLKVFSESKQNSKPKKNVINIKNKKNQSHNKKPITQDSIRKELFSKIQNLYELCLKKIEYPDNTNIKSKNKNKEDVIYMLTVIELLIVKLKSKLNVNDKSNKIKYELI